MAEKSAQNASSRNDAGGGPGVEWNRELERESLVNRRYPSTTPRRYDQPIEEDDDPVMSSDSAAPRAKIWRAG